MYIWYTEFVSVFREYTVGSSRPGKRGPGVTGRSRAAGRRRAGRSVPTGKEHRSSRVTTSLRDFVPLREERFRSCTETFGSDFCSCRTVLKRERVRQGGRRESMFLNVNQWISMQLIRDIKRCSQIMHSLDRTYKCASEPMKRLCSTVA